MECLKDNGLRTFKASGNIHQSPRRKNKETDLFQSTRTTPPRGLFVISEYALSMVIMSIKIYANGLRLSTKDFVRESVARVLNILLHEMQSEMRSLLPEISVLRN